MTTNTLSELQARWDALNDLAESLRADDRRLSTALDSHDHLVERASACNVQLVTPLTVGTLLAEVLSEIDGIELKMEGLRRNLRPGEDLPDPLEMWQERLMRDARASAPPGTR